MEKRFNNSFELAWYFMHENTDTRQWGILEPFRNATSYKYLKNDMMDKYVRGQNVMKQYLSAEYQEAEFVAMSNFISYIDKHITFPVVYECACTYADGYSAYFEVTYTTDNQLRFDGMELI